MDFMMNKIYIDFMMNKIYMELVISLKDITIKWKSQEGHLHTDVLCGDEIHSY